MAGESMYIADSWQGVHRDENKDDWLVLDAPGYRLYVVFDGVSSTKNARAVVDAIKEYLETSFRVFDGQNGSLGALLYEADSALSPRYIKDGGSTYVALLHVVKENRLLVSHLGDSRLYKAERESLAQLTKDHAVADKPHIITKSLGMEGIERSDFYETELADEKGRYLLCTDGLYEFFERVPEIVAVIRKGTLKEISEVIAKHVFENNSDDATYLVIDI